MATFDVDVGGVTYEVDAPDEATAWKWANIEHQKSSKQGKSLVDMIPGMDYVDPVGRLTDEQILKQKHLAAKSMVRAERGPVRNVIGDVAAGATALGSKILDIPSRMLNAPWLRSELGQAQDVADKDSVSYLAGGLLDPIATAAGTGAFSAAQRLAPAMHWLPQGMIGGAGAGAMIGGLQSESLEGAGIGAGVGAAIPFAMAGGKGLYNLAAPAMSRTAAQRGAAKELIEVVGEKDAKRLAEIASLKTGEPYFPLETAGQYGSTIVNPKISALEKYWTGKFGSVEAYRNREAQKALEKAKIAFLGAQTAPQREAALAEANRITGAFKVAGEKGAQYADEAAKMVEDVRRLERAGSIARGYDVAGVPTLGSGQRPVIGTGLTQASGLVEQAEKGMANAAQRSLVAGASARLADNIVGGMTDRGLKPLSAEAMIGAVRRVQTSKENITNDSLRLLSQKLINSIGRAAEANNGVLDAASLDTLRRTAIGDFIDSVSRGNPAQAKKLASNEAVSSFKQFVDDAIEAAGGKGYKDYMREYSTIRGRIEQPMLRMAESDKMAEAGMKEVMEILNTEKIHGTGVLERSVTLTQAVARALKGMGGRKVGEEGAKLMMPQGRVRLGQLVEEQLSQQPWKATQYVMGSPFGAGFGMMQPREQQ